MARGKKTAKELTPEEKLAQALVPIEEQPYQIPENWCWVRLGSISACQYGYTAKAFYGEGFPKMLRITDIQENSVDWEKIPNCKITEEELEKYLLKPKDIVIARTGATTGKSYCILNPVTAVFASYLIRLRVSQSISISFVYKFLQSDTYWKQISGLSSGIAQPGVNSTKLKNMSFPLPPLEEQQRIVERIESILAKLDEAKEKAQEVVDGFEMRKSAILHKAFTGELTEKWRENNFSGSAAEYLTAIQKDNEETTKLNFKFWTNNILPEGWVESKIGNLLYYAGRIGWKGLKADEYKDEGPLLLSVYNLNEGDKVSYNKVYHISEQRYDESPEIMVQENDILLVKDGAGIGKLAYVKDLPQKSTINSSLLLIRSGESAYFKYIYYLLSGPSLQRIVKERITGSATPHLFQRDVKEFTIPIPPLQEQKFIASVLDNMIKKEQQAKETAEVVIEQIDVMKKAVLARAFRGELGTNDPEEESAVELLKSVINL